MDIIGKIQGSLQGLKTYIILVIWLLAEVAGSQDWLDAETVATLRAFALPAAGLTMAAKVNRQGSGNGS